MTLGLLRRKLLESTRHRLGRGGVALLVMAFLFASLPVSQWHSHVDGGGVHEHSAFDGPDGHDTDPPAHHHVDEPGADDGTNLHFHDTNHSLSAVGFMAPPPADLAPLQAKLPTFAAANPPHSVLKPPYRPPIA